MSQQADLEQLREQVRRIVSALPGVRLVYLFGSQVTGEVGPKSDIDFGLLLDRGVAKWAIQSQFAHQLSLALDGPELDVVLLNDAPIELAYAIIAQGRVLFERNTAARVDYEMVVMSRYGDYLPVLRAFHEQILKEDEYAARVERYRAALGRTERALGQVRGAAGQDTERV